MRTFYIIHNTISLHIKKIKKKHSSATWKYASSERKLFMLYKLRRPNSNHSTKTQLRTLVSTNKHMLKKKSTRFSAIIWVTFQSLGTLWFPTTAAALSLDPPLQAINSSGLSQCCAQSMQSKFMFSFQCKSCTSSLQLSVRSVMQSTTSFPSTFPF